MPATLPTESTEPNEEQIGHEASYAANAVLLSGLRYDRKFVNKTPPEQQNTEHNDAMHAHTKGISRIG